MVAPAEHIIDTLLEEVLGEQSPPDLRSSIIGRLEQDQLAAGTRQEVTPPRRRTDRGTIPSHWNVAAFATAVVVTFIAVAVWFAWQPADRPDPDMARADRPRSAPSAAPSVSARQTEMPGDTERQPLPDVEVPFGSDTIAPSTAPSRHPQPDSKTDPAPKPWPESRIVAAIETHLRRAWQREGIEPSPEAGDSVWCRRLFIRLLGRIPTVDELQAFLAWPGGRRRAMLIDHLTTGATYRDEWIEHWSLYWTNVMIGRRGGLEGDRADREGMLAYWRAAVADNRPWNTIVTEILTAEGTGRPQRSDFDGAANFWLVHSTPNGIRATSQAARIFLGERIDCLRCHDRPDGEGRQEEYWALNPLFRTARVVSAGKGIFRVVSRASSSGKGDVFYERPDGRLAAAVPRFPDGREATDMLRRDPRQVRRELARQWTSSPRFARAAVNRLWFHFFGHGLARSVDDIGPGAPVDHPELLSFLADQFAAHGYDLRQLTRWIASSDAFGRSSRQIDGNERDMPERGGIAYFSRYYARPLAPEAVYQSLVLALQTQPKVDPTAMIHGRRQWVGRWTRRQATDEGGEISLFDGGVQQSLDMMNGPLIRRVTSADESRFLKQLATSSLPNESKAEHLFLAALARTPSTKERRAAVALLERDGADPTRALEDIWWALLNSNEFLLDH